MTTGTARAACEDRTGRTTVLVVEDNEATRYSVSKALARAGLDVLAAATGADGLAAVRGGGPDLVLLDVNLPDMYGFEVCAALKRDAETRKIPVVFLSASHVSVLDRVRGLDGGGDAYLTHPIEPAVLVSTVRALLRAREAEEERERALVRERVARQAAEEAQERLASALRGREEALATVSHDLRTPLQTVDLAARQLEHALPAEPRFDGARRQVATIRRASERMSSLVRDVLDLARLEAGRLSLQLASVDAAAIVDRSVEAHRLIAEAKQLALDAVRPSGLLARADASRLEQALGNLVGNAVKFTPAGGRVEIGARRKGDAILFWVADSGPGIPPEVLPRVFERFWQLADRSAGGTGLGLAIAKGIVEAHGGHIWIDSRAGEGTRVSLAVPAAHQG